LEKGSLLNSEEAMQCHGLRESTLANCKSFLRQFHAIVLALQQLDKRGGYLSQKLAKEFVEDGTEEGSDSAFKMKPATLRRWRAN